MKPSAIALVLAIASQPATAAVFSNPLTGLSGSFRTVNPSSPTLPRAAVVTNDFAPQGISFLNATCDPQPGVFSGPSIGNFTSISINPDIQFLFGSGVSSVAFRYTSNLGDCLFEAYLDDTLVPSATFSNTVGAPQ
jgi:hypothetical protein